ncbi:MAG: DNA polymerase III subunit epsilon [Pseudomonadota bacterium]
MRQIVLDTETTGLNPRTGNRIIEIGCVELMNRQLTGKNFHCYLNPERESEEGALAVHGLTTEFLLDKPKFAQIAPELQDYLAGAEIIIHNAPFDVGFLDAEFGRLNIPRFREQVGEVIDTLVQAKELHPGKRNSLDALCDRYGVSNAHRTLHGALLDAELLAEVYLAMTRGQNTLSMELEQPATTAATFDEVAQFSEMNAIRILPANPDELAAHEALLQSLDKEIRGKALWRLSANG